MPQSMIGTGFHYEQDVKTALPVVASGADTTFTYTFQNFFHPYVGEMIGQLNTKSLAGLLDPDTQNKHEDFFTTYYNPLSSDYVTFNPFPTKEIDVQGGPYANYNWELFFHLPLAVATHLSKNQRFAEAQRWFHYIFDPTCNDTSIPPPQRFWKFLRFRENTDVQQIGDLVALLSKPDKECTQTERDLKTVVLAGYHAIQENPFQPHRVARTRTLAYQYCVVMKYLDNLIDWGDSLFIQDTMESINEATLLYVLAANLLGPRPQQLPERGTVRPKTFAQLKVEGLDAMGNAMVDLESQFPFNAPMAQSKNAGGDRSGPLFGIGRTLYFCIPRNDKLLTYWDTVADRLFKIRHCMNIEGVVQQLPLFDPPLDPGMLVKAAAAGIDVGSIVSGLGQPISPVRSLLLIQKALELCGEVRALGSALLSALEKGDGEHLALLRQGHEIRVQQMAQEVRFLQWKQAQAATESLLRSRESALERYKYYQRLLGLTPDSQTAPETLPLDRRELTEENFDSAYSALVGQFDLSVPVQPFPPLTDVGDSSPAIQSGASGTGQLHLNQNEHWELDVLLPLARDTRLKASDFNTMAHAFTYIPDLTVNGQWWGIGASTLVFGGTKIADAFKIAAEIYQTEAAWEQDSAGMMSRTGSYQRRADEWLLQNNLAARELMQIGRQILSSLIAEQIAYREYLNIQQQIAQAQEVQSFLQTKFTSEELYIWMQGEISRLYYEYYRFAFDTARKAEQTMKHELMRPEVDNTDCVQFNYWDAGRKGLLSGEALYLDVKRMEMAYHDNNKRELEMTRHISLRQLDPLALLTLKTTGMCQVSIPEWLYDRDCPGHYMRRIKSVAVSLPSVVGPYTAVNCTLSLLRSSLRTSPLLKDGTTYGRTGPDDDRFVDYFGSMQSVVTSGATSDSGMFETNLHDERFLPFEGAGAVSTWSLELPNAFRPFDYMTISDVLLHVRYTARQGVDRKQVLSELRDMLTNANESGLALLFSLPHDFPTEWSAFLNGTSDFAVRLRKDYFPYVVQSEKLKIAGLELYAVSGGNLKRRVVGPTSLVGDFNGPNGYSDLPLAPDDTVLKREQAPIFLLIRYSVVAQSGG